MPLTLRIGLGIAFCALVGLGVVSSWFILHGGVRIVLAPIAGAAVIAIAGLIRGVTWGRVLTSILLFIAVFFVFANLMPISGRPAPHFLEIWFGGMPPTELLWLAIVLLAIVLLWPVYVLSKYSATFRSAPW